MSNFTPLVAKQYEFHGDKITVTFARIKRKDMLKLMPAFSRMKDDDSEGINDALNIAVDLLPKYVKTFEGLTDADGNAIDIQTVADEMYFMELAADLCMDLIEESTVLFGGKAKK